MKLEKEIADLKSQMQRQQRHRLLHGFPMSSGMKPIKENDLFRFDPQLMQA